MVAIGQLNRIVQIETQSNQQRVVGGTAMASKTAKLAALPAVLGFASVRVYALSEAKAEDLLSPQELSVYTPRPQQLRFVEDQPGALQQGLGVVRLGLQPYIRSLKNACVTIKIGAVNVYHAGQDAYEYLKDPPAGFIPRVSVITVSGLAGLILARKGTRLKRIGVSLGLATLGTAVCYPTQTVGALKITGRQAYAATKWASSSVASLWKPSPAKDVIASSASPEVAPVPSPEPEVPPAKPAPEAEPTPPPAEEPAPSPPAEETSPAPPPEAVPAPAETPAAPAPPETAQSEEPAPLSPVPEPSPEPASPGPVTEAPSVEPPVDSRPEETGPQAPPPAEDTAPLLAASDPITASAPVEEPASSPAAADPASVEPSAEVPEKARFTPDPKLLDHGQSNPEDADLYSTRS
ncbi:hypothetical protein AGOR_G00077260 [Albula goreensis]|uniref:MICOS complex subunit n=1 Tax=Albula goreensis TaxID=1534307 RepID=A0A8T3DRN2_9TELE|nr:hypothetical protein AGOR_G00077260 [Albula goreensis]